MTSTLSLRQQKKFQQALLEWYEEHGKNLPWRKGTEPYQIWISEIMSQQTQVETVIPYYERFLTTFPDVSALARANDEKLLKLWEGLGYYSRARNLKVAAQQMVENFSGRFPVKIDDIRSLKGIGPYTAAAIASICYGQKEPAIDGNLMRVSSRLFELEADASRQADKKIFDAALRPLMPEKEPGNFNQALMDLGSQICKPKNPDCKACPLKEFCQACKNQTIKDFPIKTGKVKTTDFYYLAFAIKNERGEYLFEQRPIKGLLASMWTFPLLEQTNEVFDKEEVSLPAFLSNQVIRHKKLGEIKHLFSHQKWTVRLIDCQLADGISEALSLLPNQRFISLSNLTDFALAGPQIKLMSLIEKS